MNLKARQSHWLKLEVGGGGGQGVHDVSLSKIKGHRTLYPAN